MSRYTIGIDFGTLSSRACIVRAENGEVAAMADRAYPHGVMTEALPTGEPLPQGWALEHPQDYLDCMQGAVAEALQKSGVSPEDIAGIGIDFTSSTVLPVTKDGTPLCLLPEFAHEKNAWVKLWKHHGAQAQTNRLNEVVSRFPGLMKYYGGKFGSEWSLPKLLETLEEAPQVYEAMDEWAEACDWLVWQLTGVSTHSLGGAGVKEMYDADTGEYPDREFLKAVDPRLEHYYDEKHKGKPIPIGTKAGELCEAWAEKLGLKAGIPVAAGNLDGHVAAPVMGMEKPGQLMTVIGTSGVWFALSPRNERLEIPGICCGVADSMLPDLVCYEAGQSCVGDMYNWFVERCVPESCRKAAEEAGENIHVYLTRLAEKLKPGESGLVALDWFNGNRSILADSDLTGLFIGLTLNTRPEEMYRALLESAAFGGRMIRDNYVEHGVKAESLIATGGISRKNALAMQIYADVLNLPVHIAGSDNGPAHGAALYGAVAAGLYENVAAAAAAMKQPYLKTYTPIPENVKVYQRLYEQYSALYRYFGTGSPVMKELLDIKLNTQK